MRGNHSRVWIRRLAGLFVGLGLSALHGPAPRVQAAEGAATKPSTNVPADGGGVAGWQGCNTPHCRAVDSDEACVACRLGDFTTADFPDDAFTLEARAVDNGVVLRVVSEDVRVQEVLWAVSVARAQMLERVRHGDHVPLCAACLANVHSLGTLDITAQRTANGALLTYTSSDPEIVSVLHAMIQSSADLPL